MCLSYSKGKGKVKQSLCRPRQALRVPWGWGSQISRQSANEGGKVVGPTHRPPLPPQEILLILIYVTGWVNPRATVRPAVLCQQKIPMTPLRTEPAFCLQVQCLTQLHNHVSHLSYYKSPYILYTNFLQIQLTRIYEMHKVCLSVCPSIHPSTYPQTVPCSTNSNLVNCVFIQKATIFWWSGLVAFIYQDVAQSTLWLGYRLM